MVSLEEMNGLAATLAPSDIQPHTDRPAAAAAPSDAQLHTDRPAKIFQEPKTALLEAVEQMLKSTSLPEEALSQVNCLHLIFTTHSAMKDLSTL